MRDWYDNPQLEERLEEGLWLKEAAGAGTLL